MTAEEFIKDCTRGCSNELVAVEDRNGKEVISYHEWLTPDQALRAVEMAREEVRQKMIKEAQDYADSLPKSAPKRRCKNDLVQFEVKSANGRNIRDEYDWCLENLPLKEERGLFYHVTEFYIVTRSQRIIDKVNRHFGSTFGFKHWHDTQIFYIA